MIQTRAEHAEEAERILSDVKQTMAKVAGNDRLGCALTDTAFHAAVANNLVMAQVHATLAAIPKGNL